MGGGGGQDGVGEDGRHVPAEVEAPQQRRGAPHPLPVPPLGGGAEGDGEGEGGSRGEGEGEEDQ